MGANAPTAQTGATAINGDVALKVADLSRDISRVAAVSREICTIFLIDGPANTSTYTVLEPLLHVRWPVMIDDPRA